MHFSLPASTASALAFLLASFHPAFSDQPDTIQPYIATDRQGVCYARSVPSHDFDENRNARRPGRTTTHVVTMNGDVLVDTYNWFSLGIRVECWNYYGGYWSDDDPAATKIYVVRMPDRHVGQPSNDHIAIAFYTGGKLLRAYGPIDIARNGGPVEKDCAGKYNNVEYSISHYWVFDVETSPEFIRSVAFDHTLFEVVTVDGRKLTFRLDTGDLLESRRVSEPPAYMRDFKPC